MKNLKVRRGTLIKGSFCFFVPLQLFLLQVKAQLIGYGYTRNLTIQASQVFGTLSNFPVLVSVTNNSLRTVGNGGRVRNNNGYDIAFTMGNCSTVLPYQIERYSPSTGEYVAWVQVPSLSSASNTTLTMFYGNSSITTNPSTPDVWDNNYMGVWHFNNTVNDATDNNRNLSNVNTTNYNTGKIAQGRRLNTTEVESDDNDCRYLQLPSNMFNSVNSFTFEGWVYLDENTTNWERIFDFGRNTDINMFLTPSIEGSGNGIKRFAITTDGNGEEERISSTTGTTTDRWHYFVVTINNSNDRGYLYYDGVLNATNNNMDLRPSDLIPNNSNYFGRSHYGNDHGLYGKIDEFRISNTARSADWVATSYRNQNNPSDFYTLSTELATTTLCGILPVTLTAFDGEANADGTNTISWTTAEEQNNAKFILERSANGTDWEDIKTLAVDHPNSTITRSYSVQDNNPLLPVSYYRLKQVDRDGRTTVYSIIAVKQSRDGDDHFIVRPNPAYNRVFIEMSESLRPQDTQIKLMSSSGLAMPVQPSFNGNIITLDMPGIATGVYFLHIYRKGQQYSRKLLIVQ